MTRGEKVIRPDFARSEEIRQAKTMYALLYDKLEEIIHQNYDRGPVDENKREIIRCANEAQRYLETAAMYAVKAMTVE